MTAADLPPLMPGGEYTSAQLRRVEQELRLARIEVEQRGSAINELIAERNKALADIEAVRTSMAKLAEAELQNLLADNESLRTELAETFRKAGHLAVQLDLARAEASSARYERDQVIKRAVRAETELDLLRTQVQQLQQGDATA